MRTIMAISISFQLGPLHWIYPFQLVFALEVDNMRYYLNSWTLFFFRMMSLMYPALDSGRCPFHWVAFVCFRFISMRYSGDFVSYFQALAYIYNYSHRLIIKIPYHIHCTFSNVVIA